MPGDHSDSKRKKVPLKLIEFVNDKHMKQSLPIRFRFADKPFILEVMELFDLSADSTCLSDNNRVRFARNGEGFVLIVDLNTDNLEIMQEEFGDIDYINLTLDDLCNAEWVSI